MIVTLTANPSIDRTVSLPGTLARDTVQRSVADTAVAGGKGVNVARVLHSAGVATVAIFPTPTRDPFLIAIAASRLPHVPVESHAPVRLNLALTEPDGTTTKINAPGRLGPGPVLTDLTSAVVENAELAHWVVISGSLPPEAPSTYYSTLIRELRASTSAFIAVDTSDAPLSAVIAGKDLPDLLKPNATELEQISGSTGIAESAAAGDFEPAIAAARAVVEAGIPHVLATLGGAGAILVTASGTWIATAPSVATQSTVGAGDSALAGYLIAACRGLADDDRLRYAVAYGTTAASMSGSTLPTPGDVDSLGALSSTTCTSRSAD